jgi:hypothetical protein
MLKKISLPLVALTAVAGVAQAETFKISDNTSFGVNVDLGAYYASVKNSSGKAENQIAGKGLNQVKFEGSSKLAGGTKVFGKVEIDFDPVKDNDGVKTDDIKIGVAGSFGQIQIGQFDSYAEDKVFEALGVGHGEYGFVTEAKSGNDGRHLQYTNKMGPLSFGLDLTHIASASDATKSSTGTAVALIYKLDQLTIGYAHDKISAYDSDGAAASAKSTDGLSVNYKLGDAELVGFVGKTKPVSGSDSTNYSGVAAKYKMGAVDFGLAFQKVKTGSTSTNETSFGVGYEAYKDMTIYADMVKKGLSSKKGDAIEVGVIYSF